MKLDAVELFRKVDMVTEEMNPNQQREDSPTASEETQMDMEGGVRIHDDDPVRFISDICICIYRYTGCAFTLHTHARRTQQQHTPKTIPLLSLIAAHNARWIRED